MKEKSERKERKRIRSSHDGRAASNARSSSMHSVHLVCTSRAFSSSGRIVSGVNDSTRLRLSPSCSSGVGGGAERTEPVSRPRREDVRRGLLLLRSALLGCACASRCGPWLWSLSSWASAISSTFDRRVGRMYVDDVTALVGNGRGGRGGVGTGMAVAARDTWEREPEDGDSAHKDSDDCDAFAEVPFFSGWHGYCLVLRPRTVAAPFTSFSPRACAAASKSSAESIWSQSSSSSIAPLRSLRSDPLLYEWRIGCEASWGLDSFLAGGDFAF